MDGRSKSDKRQAGEQAGKGKLRARREYQSSMHGGGRGGKGKGRRKRERESERRTDGERCGRRRRGDTGRLRLEIASRGVRATLGERGSMSIT